MTLGEDAKATRVALTVGKEGVGQSYSIRVQDEGGRRVITVRGADAVGAMYGGLDVAEAIRNGTLDALRDSEHQPHIAQRGIKFNIPLDLRTPSYTDCSDAGQANIPVMWEREFWTEFLDAMARHRYNVLSLWSLHPFPSLVKVPEFPEVALDDVWRTRAGLDDTFSFAGTDMVRPGMLADHEVVKRTPIEEKIEFWRWVMQHAAHRGIRVYFFTWNVFTLAPRAGTASPTTWATRSRRSTSAPLCVRWSGPTRCSPAWASRRARVCRRRWIPRPRKPGYGTPMAKACATP
jgi:hypothetical protein